MKVVLQRVARAQVTIDNRETRRIGPGLVLLLGVRDGDEEKTARFLAEKAANLRIFDDEGGNLNRSLLEEGGECLVVSNFTLYANSRKGRRPSFVEAAKPEVSGPLYTAFIGYLREAGVIGVQTGEFGADMQVELVNDGPITIILDSDEMGLTTRI